ncbi:MAG: hypothetical protein EA344_00820 [Alkalicoccus sp.]|nr:MAG: hypothetical protein EA344_00820 [Alkalicoccus sp.]
MTALKDLTQEQKTEYIIAISLLAVSVAVGIVVGMNEEWFARRNFTAGYMAGSLLSVILLFAVYRSISFLINMFRKK